MALRSKARSFSGSSVTRLFVVIGLTAPLAMSQSYRYEIRHQQWRGGSPGTLLVSPDGISFEERGTKKETDARSWRYEEIQQLTVSPLELRILTYQDVKWKLGRDREYVFDRFPKELAVETYPLWTSKLGQRFIAALPTPESAAEWKAGAKLDHGLSGTLGTLIIGREQMVFDAGERGASRSWRLIDIESVSSLGPFDLTVTTIEKSGLFRGGSRQFHFQLQQPLKEAQYNALWQRVNRSKGLTFIDSAAAEGEGR